MKIGIIIISVLLFVAVAFIFLLIKVLKNTCLEFYTSKILNNVRNGEAFDDTYYPATLLLGVYPAAKDGIETIVDFSMYDTDKIIGFQIFTNDLEKIDYGEFVVPNAVVFQPVEGTWLWKLQ